ncbi:MAG: hypothetical protein B7Z74_11210, partial [Deltaproteobacteria bacterium 21-66-5]
RAAVGEGRLRLPERVILAGFDAPSPLEVDLFEALAGRSQVVRLTCAAEGAAVPAVQVFGTMMQECRAVCAAVLEAWNEGRTALGVVYLDPSYFDVLKRCFDELAGEGPRPDLAKEIRYNLAGGLPLEAHPLFLTALLPLRCAAEPAPASLLASLLCSPYAGAGAGRAARGAIWKRWPTRRRGKPVPSQWAPKARWPGSRPAPAGFRWPSRAQKRRGSKC